MPGRSPLDSINRQMSHVRSNGQVAVGVHRAPQQRNVRRFTFGMSTSIRHCVVAPIWLGRARQRSSEEWYTRGSALGKDAPTLDREERPPSVADFGGREKSPEPKAVCSQVRRR